MNRILTGEPPHPESQVTQQRRQRVEYSGPTPSEKTRHRPASVRYLDNASTFQSYAENPAGEPTLRHANLHGSSAAQRNAAARRAAQLGNKDVPHAFRDQRDWRHKDMNLEKAGQDGTQNAGGPRFIDADRTVTSVRKNAGENYQPPQRPAVHPRQGASRSDTNGPRRGYVEDAPNSHRNQLNLHGHKRYESLRITTRRPVYGSIGIPANEGRPSYVPRYIKDSMTEMEFEPRLVQRPGIQDPHWFLMPVQGWFVLSIILAALFIVFVVIILLLYRTVSKQKKKIRKLLASSRCGDPLHHELCSCRRGLGLRPTSPFVGTLVRPIDGRYNGELSGTLQLPPSCGASAMAQKEAAGQGTTTLQRGSGLRATLQRGSHFTAPGYDQPNVINLGNGRRLHAPEMAERSKDELRDEKENSEKPPPLAPKTLHPNQEHTRKQQLQHQQQELQPEQQSQQELEQQLKQHDHTQHQLLQHQQSLSKSARFLSPDIHLRTLYPPPPTRFHF